MNTVYHMKRSLEDAAETRHSAFNLSPILQERRIDSHLIKNPYRMRVPFTMNDTLFKLGGARALYVRTLDVRECIVVLDTESDVMISSILGEPLVAVYVQRDGVLWMREIDVLYGTAPVGPINI